MTRTRILIFTLACYLFFSGCSDKSLEKPPNIIIILADDLGYNDLSSYRARHPGTTALNPPTCQTPNIDRLADEGMLFTDFYAGAAVCSPSRAALLTGRNATRVGIYNWVPENSPMHLRDEEITIAELLKNMDYLTGHFGKWHLTSRGNEQPLPNDQGYDYSFFTYNNAIPSHHNPENFFRNGIPVGKLEGYACGLVVDEAIQWLESISKDGPPFYMNVWFNEPHTIVAAPDELVQRHTYNQKYYGSIENMDIAVGKLLDYLKKNGLDKNTILIFTSDNGSQWDHSNDPLRGEKCFNYEGGVRVPFIIKWAEKIPRGEVSSFPGSFTDIFPTLASIAGLSLPSERAIDGMDISMVFFGKEKGLVRKEPIFFFRYFHDPVCMLRVGDWCLLGYDVPIPEGTRLNVRQLAKTTPWHFLENHMQYLKTATPKYFELYDLKNDPEQKQDVAGQYPEVVAAMKSKMSELLKEMLEEGGDWYSCSSIVISNAERDLKPRIERRLVHSSP